jgi:phosphoglycerol transferase MdoB-like AlkP superfamily enzyme
VADAWSRDSIVTYSEGIADADRGFQRLVDWASKRKRPTVIAFFGDHLPPLGAAYVATGFLKDNVPPRNAPADEMLGYRETPLVVWSNRKGAVRDIGTVSPAFLPLLLMRQAGIEHPYYTGALGDLYERYHVVDRHVLIGADGAGKPGWSRDKVVDAAVRDHRLLQYDILFGERFGERRFFPKPVQWEDLLVRLPVEPSLPSARNPV